MTIRFTDPVPQPRRWLSAVASLGAIGLFSWLAGCSVIADADRAQCSTTSDCTNRGPEFAGTICSSAGVCEGDPSHPQCTKDTECATISGAICTAGFCEVDPQWSCRAAPANASLGYKLTMHLQDAVSQKSLRGVTAQLCKKLDVTCDSPIGATVVSDDNGGVTMQIEAAFDGYVLMRDTKIAPALYFLTAPASGDLDLPTVPLATPFQANGIVSSAGGNTWKEDRGIVLLNAFDCQGKPAANLTFSAGGTIDPATFIFYLVGNYPTTNSTATDSTGYGGLVNVPVGVTTIAATLNPGGHKVSTTSILVRAGFVSYSSVTPNSL